MWESRNLCGHSSRLSNHWCKIDFILSTYFFTKRASSYSGTILIAISPSLITICGWTVTTSSESPALAFSWAQDLGCSSLLLGYSAVSPVGRVKCQHHPTHLSASSPMFPCHQQGMGSHLKFSSPSPAPFPTALLSPTSGLLESHSPISVLHPPALHTAS